MKTMRVFIWMMICCLLISLAVSCEKDAMAATKDESLYGTWVLDDVVCRVNASDDYVAEILEGKIKEDFVYMEDTIQFFENGYFFEGPFVIENTVDPTPEEVSIPRNYRVSDGNLIISPWANENVVEKRAEYEVDGYGIQLLIITPDISDLFSYDTYLKQIDQDPSTVKNIEYTLIYKKID